MWNIPDLILKELPLYRDSVQVVTDYNLKQKIKDKFFFSQQLIEEQSKDLSYYLYDKDPDNFDIDDYIKNFFLSDKEIILLPLDDNDDLNFAVLGLVDNIINVIEDLPFFEFMLLSLDYQKFLIDTHHFCTITYHSNNNDNSGD